MQFAMYLVENGVISCEDFFEAVKLQLHLGANQTRGEKPMVDVLVGYDFLSAALAEYHLAEYRRCVQLGQRELVTAGA